MANVTARGTSSLIGMIPKRYASAAAANPKASEKKSSPLPKEPVRVTKSNVVVASLENYSPITRVAAVVNSGSRDETSAQRGVSHALRIYSSLATKNYSQFGLSRTLNQIGAQLSISSDREKTTFLLETTRSNFARGIDILADIISRPELRRWEISDAQERFEFELDVYDEKPELRIVDLIHRAAFKNALSRSLYAPRFNLKNLSENLVEEFRNNTFTSDRLVLVGTGIQHDNLLRHAESFRLPSGAGVVRQQAVYLGGEIREENLSDYVHVALAHEGVSSSSKDALASAIISHAFGTGGPRIKYSLGASKIEKAVLGLVSEAAAVSSFNANYSDAGIFGFHIVSNKKDIGKVVRAVANVTANTAKSGLSKDEITRAKNSLKLSLSVSLDNSKNLIDEIAKNPDQANKNLDINETFKLIDAVSAESVNALLKKISSSKPSLAAIGDLTELPRIGELAA